MNWATFYLICFVVGLAFTFVSLLGGTGKLHLGGRAHLHLGHGVHHPGAAPAAGAGPGAPGAVPFLNFFTLMAFLTWFGGTGFLLTRYSSLWFLAALALAGASGLAGAGVVFWFLAKVLIAHTTYLDPADFEMVGTLGRIASPIRAGGTGEIIFSRAGVRKAAGARSDDGSAIERGAEVVITRYESGIAYVRRWEELTQ